MEAAQTRRVSSVDVGGLRIAYERRGDGPAVLLLHGGVCDGRVWRQALENLSDEFPGLGHELYLESPDAFVSTVRPFLRSVP
jgi:pimeloyl-ACP methyl ester carboxylesterase